MLLLDARVLNEKQPTGVSVVAGQFIAGLQKIVPAARQLSATDSWSNTYTNGKLLLELITLEEMLAWQPRWIFSPNIGFRHTQAQTKIAHLVHDLSFRHTPYWFSTKTRWWHRVVRPEKQIREAEMVLAVSQWTANALSTELNIPRERITVVAPHTPPRTTPMRPALPFSTAPFFLFLGTVERRKNVAATIAAFEQIKKAPRYIDFHLLLVGRRGFGAPEKLPERVHWLPYVTSNEKQWLYDHATALVYPSFYEGFGLPPLEAAAANCPTIISCTTALPETMAGASLEVSPYHVDEISLAMQAIVVDDNLRARLIVRGQERAQFFSPERQESALSALLAKMEL